MINKSTLKHKHIKTQAQEKKNIKCKKGRV